MTRVPSFVILAGWLSAVLMSCQPEPQDVDKLIIGRWELERALRDGDSTNTLQGLYFEFYEDGSMSTNLPVNSGTSNYQVTGNQILQGSAEAPLQYEVQSISDSLMVLDTRLRQYKFVFLLRKKVPES